MTLRSYDLSYFISEDSLLINNAIAVKFNYREQIDKSEEIGDWIETFATGPFIMSLRSIIFTSEKDAVIFSLKYLK